MLGGLSVFIVVLLFSFLGTKIIMKQQTTTSSNNRNIIENDPDSQDEELDFIENSMNEMTDDDFEMKSDIFIIGEGDQSQVKLTSSSLVTEARRPFQISKLLNKKRKKI